MDITVGKQASVGKQAARAKAELQRRVRNEISHRAMSPDQLAGLLDLLPVGAEVLLAQKDWSLDTTFFIADALGLEIEFNVKNAR